MLDNVLKLIDDKLSIQNLWILLPLITFFYYNQHLLLISFLSCILALNIIYITILKNSKNKNKIKKIIFTNVKDIKEFEKIMPFPLLWLFLTIINILSIFYSFYLSLINLNNISYNIFIFLAHLFIITFQIFILIIRKNISKKMK